MLLPGDKPWRFYLKMRIYVSINDVRFNHLPLCSSHSFYSESARCIIRALEFKKWDVTINKYSRAGTIYLRSEGILTKVKILLRKDCTARGRVNVQRERRGERWGLQKYCLRTWPGEKGGKSPPPRARSPQQSRAFISRPEVHYVSRPQFIFFKITNRWGARALLLACAPVPIEDLHDFW